MIKKFILTLMVMAMIACASVGFAYNSAAVDAAKAEIPVTCEMFSYEEDDGKTEMYFRDTATGMLYKVETVSATGRVLEVEIKNRSVIPGTKVVKTRSDIRDIILAAYPDARHIRIELDRDDFRKVEYDVHFVTGKYRGEAELSAETGEFMKIELEYF